MVSTSPTWPDRARWRCASRPSPTAPLASISSIAASIVTAPARTPCGPRWMRRTAGGVCWTSSPRGWSRRPEASGVGEAIDRGIPVGGDQRSERLHEVERRAVEPCPVARVDVLLGTPSPSLAARHQLQLDDALGAERHRHGAVRVLRRRGHEDARAALESGAHLGPPHDLLEVRRADLFLPLRDEDEVDGRLPPCAVDRMESREERRLGAPWRPSNAQFLLELRDAGTSADLSPSAVRAPAARAGPAASAAPSRGSLM
jgi:hypothetical protein